jgi:hypothetical protein
MAKKNKAVYAPGELSRVREKLGTLDEEEAKQLVQKLGGVIGYERTDEEEKTRQGLTQRIRHEKVDVKIGDRPSSRPRRAVELPTAAEAENSETGKKKQSRRKDIDPADDPTIPLKSSYWDRLRLDRFAGQPEFEIKSSAQVFQSMLSFFAVGPDYISSAFATTRMTEYYKKIELMARFLFPLRNSAEK